MQVIDFTNDTNYRMQTLAGQPITWQDAHRHHDQIIHLVDTELGLNHSAIIEHNDDEGRIGFAVVRHTRPDNEDQ